MSTRHPCVSCGACCASFRVSFYWAEADDGHGEVPAELTAPLGLHHRAMLGTLQAPLRCVALEGEIGTDVSCSIYAKRSSTCREFQASWEDGTQNEACDRARVRHGMLPLSPGDFNVGHPRAA